MLQVLGSSAMGSRVHVDLLLRRQADERVAHVPATTCWCATARPARPSPADAADGPRGRGRYLGLALETVSRSLTRLQEEGLIEVSGRSVRVLDRASALRRMAMLPDTPLGSPLERQA